MNSDKKTFYNSNGPENIDHIIIDILGFMYMQVYTKQRRYVKTLF